MKRKRHVILKLTQTEASALHVLMLNGWGDGDYAILRDGKHLAAVNRGWEKLIRATQEARQKR